MQHHLRHLLIAALALLPMLAFAHPGHSAFDPTVAPHPDHAWEYLLLLCGAIGLVAIAVCGFFKAGR